MTHALTLHFPSAVGNIDAYIQAANRYPMLTEAEEIGLAERFHNDGDVEAARQLVLSHLRLVISIARGYLGYGLPHADLIQEGNIGLMKAVKRFDSGRGVRLVSFAMHWIKAEIHEYILKNWRMVKVATTKAQRKLFFNLRSMKQGFKADAGTDDATHRDTLSEGEIDIMARELNGNPDDSDDAFAPIDYLADSRYEPTRVLENKSIAHLQGEGLHEALNTLDPRSRRIIETRWLHEEGEGATLHDLAAEFSVSAERIRQIEVKALQKMRSVLIAA